MKLTQKLLGLLHRVFDPDPEQFLALRIQYDGGLTWDVTDGVLTTKVVGGPGSDLTVDLLSLTLRQLISFIAAQPGYSIPGAASGNVLSLSARVLIDSSGDIALSNGDHLYAYTSLTWAFLEPAAVELKAAKAQIPQAIRQMSILTAEDAWIDELGEFYGVKRQQGENDASYGPRIIAEVVRPRANNVAMEAAISYYTGQKTKVTDVVEYGDAVPTYNSILRHDSAHTYSTEYYLRYGLFDVEYGYDLLSGDDQQEFADRVRLIIERLRAAGTHLRALSLKAGSIRDTLTPPTDGAVNWIVRPGLIDQFAGASDDLAGRLALSTFTDALTQPEDSTVLTINFGYTYNSQRFRNSKINYQGGLTVNE
jgi:hypothetical protein